MGEYYKLRSEIKELVRKKKIDGWNEVIEKANKDFHENRKEFWAFFGKTSKGSRKGIASLRSTSGSCVTSIRESWKYYVSIMKGWIQHYWMIIFDDSWKEHIDKKMTEYMCIVKCLVCRRIRFWIEGLVMHKLKSVLKA